VLVFGGANVNAADAAGATPLHYAASAGLAATAELLLTHGADVTACDRYLRTPLLTAVEVHHGREARAATIVESLARKGAVLNPRPPTVAPLMHALLHTTDGGLVRRLVELGADPSAADLVGVTPAYNAAATGCHVALEALLQCGASLRLRHPPAPGRAPPGFTVVHLVALSGDARAMAAIVEHAAEREILSEPDAEGRSPLHYAAAAGATDALQCLLGPGGLPADALCRAGVTPLGYALAAGRTEAAGLLLAAGASCRVVDKSGALPVSAAAAGRNRALVRAVLDLAPEANLRDGGGAGPLHVAARAGDVGVVAELVDAGADVLLCDRAGRTAAHVAAEAGHAEACGLLASLMGQRQGKRRGVDVAGCVDVSGRTLLHAAAAHGRSGVAAALLDAGLAGAAGAMDVDRNTPLLLAAASGDAGCVAALLDCPGTDVEHRDWAARTALAVAAGQGHAECVRVLLEAGADAEAPDARGWAPLHHAASAGSAPCCAALAQAGDRGVDIATGKGGLTPLHCAAVKGHVVAALALLRAGASVRAEDPKGRTPVALAAMAGHKACAKAIEDEAASRAVRR